SKADAAAMAETLRRLLQQRQGVKVEIISAQDLIKRAEEKKDDKKDDKKEEKKDEKKAGLIEPSHTTEFANAAPAAPARIGGVPHFNAATFLAAFVMA